MKICNENWQQYERSVDQNYDCGILNWGKISMLPHQKPPKASSEEYIIHKTTAENGDQVEPIHDFVSGCCS